MPEAGAVRPLFIGSRGWSGTTLAVDLLRMHLTLSPVYETGFVLEAARPEADIARILRAPGLEDRSTEMLAQFRDRIWFDPARIAGKDRDLTTSAEVEAITGPTMVALGYC